MLALSLGDPAGVGPELIAEAWARRHAERLPPFAVVHGAGVLRAAAERRGIDLAVAPIAHLVEAPAVFGHALPVLGKQDAEYRPGEPGEQGARLALASLQEATALAVEGAASAVVTLPVSKDELAKVGFMFPGQTEFLAHASARTSEQAVMMLAGPSLRTVPITVHCALAEVTARLTVASIVTRCRIVAEALRRDFGLPSPRLAVCGVNPHAGENGRMGREEIEIIVPAIDALRAEGINASGPYPADTLFAAHLRPTYDVAIAMYHDQALVPLKTLDFDQGVNITLGLPIVRTSPDHGTAFNIAGSGKASPAATIAAIRMAGQIAARRAAA